MRIGSHDIRERVLIVAEIGNNHEGSAERAAALIREAAACGVDAVKFQTFRAEHYVDQADTERFARLKRFELPYSVFEELAGLARSLGLLFLSTPFDLESARALGRFADALKIASGDNDFYPLLACAAETGLPVLVSSGVSDLSQVQRAVAALTRKSSPKGPHSGVAVLHCVSSYPTAPDQANLRAISTLVAALDVPVGYSDHTLGCDAAIVAVALGARIIEKHFTLDKHLSEFRDHLLSADPVEMRELIRRVRAAELLLGTGEKTLQPSEREIARAIRRSVAAAADLPSGHVVTHADLTWTRPATGLRPGEEHRLIGRRLRRAVRLGEALSAGDVDNV
jgi:N,N'-diacetyllegionaminate synthase